jgi:glyoxylase-like metal-dependent hydrolase (beta-lactamase superfamily II)
MHGGSPEQMLSTLKDMRAKLPSNTLIHPGHNYAVQPTASMQEQIRGNPFMHFDRLPAFEQYRLFDHGKIRSQPYAPVSRAVIQGAYKET